MKIKSKIFSLFFIVLLITVVMVASVNGAEKMNGMWISTVYNLDYPNKPTTDSQVLKAECDVILDNCKAMGVNNIFLQVRPNNDALYKSNIYPWSAYLTGSQGTAPSDGFDPLQYWIDGAHARGIKLHAWVNPYRATKIKAGFTGDAMATLANSSPAKQHPEYVIKYNDGNYYYNPALPEVRKLVTDGIMEIVNNYNVDGIHMDDYFYPGSDFNDESSFQKLRGGFTDKSEWRRNNVNLLVSGIKSSINQSGKNIEFGISPAGIWANKSNNPLGSDTAGNEAYYSHYADTRKWALNGTVDYIAPQIYWEMGHNKADYTTLVKWWADTLANAPAKLYIGLADYRAYNVSDTSNVWCAGNEIMRQLALNDTLSKVGGEIHFRYKMIIETPALVSKLTNYYSSNNNTETTVVTTATTTQATTAITSTELTTESTTVTTTSETTTEITTKEVTTTVNKQDSDSIKVKLNDKFIDFDTEPIIIKGRTLVPMRAVFEALGAEVIWNNDTRSVIATAKNGTKITLIIDSDDMLINGKDIFKLDVPATIRDSRTLVPLRAISETFGCEVNWDGDQKLVTIIEK